MLKDKSAFRIVNLECLLYSVEETENTKVERISVQQGQWPARTNVPRLFGEASTYVNGQW